MKRNILILCFFVITVLIGDTVMFTTPLPVEDTTLYSLENDWATDPVQIGVPVGSSFNLTCQLTDHKTVVWQFNNQPLGFGDVLFQRNSHGRFSLSEIDNGSLLQISDAQTDDSGLYKCQSSDVRDLTHVVSVLDNPKLNVSCLGKVGLLQWNINRQNGIGNEKPIAVADQTIGQVKKVIVQRSRKDSNEWETLQEVDGENTETKVKLIIRDQKYRILWTDSLGVEWISNESPTTPCTAPQDVPLSNPTDIQASIQQDDDKLALVIYWTGIPEHHYMSEDIFYRLHYKELKSEDWETIDIETEDRLYCKYETYIDPESEEPKYIVQIEAGNVIGLSGAPMSPVIVDKPLSTDNAGVVTPLPKFISESELILAKPGDTVTLKCEHETENQYAFVWSKNSSETPLAIMGYRVTNNHRYQSEDRNLIIINLQPSDSDTYICKVQMNPVGHLSHVLIVGDTIPVTNVDVHCSADEPEAGVYVTRCMGVIDQMSVRDTRYGYYSNRYKYVRECTLFTGLQQHMLAQLEPYDSTIKVQRIGHEQGGSFETTVNKTTVTVRLHPFNTYKFSVSNRNIYGQSEFVESETTCETHPDIPWRNPFPVTLTRMDRFIVVLWKELEAYEMHGSGLLYKITHSTDNETFVHNTTKSFFVINNIDEDAVYKVSVVSSNDLGDCSETPVNQISYPTRVREAKCNFFPSFYPTDEAEASITVGLGEEATLECHKTGNSSIMWRKLPEKMIIVMDDVILSRSQFKLDEETGDLTISEMQEADYGYYECVSYQGNHISSYVWELVSKEDD